MSAGAPLVVALGAVGAAHTALVGHKAARLGMLHAAGFPVPDGVCVTTAAFRQATQPSEALVRAVAEAGLPAPLAVRSSATAEDLAAASFAGQYETVLGVGDDDLAGAIARCWRSFFTEGARAARAAARRDPEADAMAVLIQPLLAAECAGVCFTVDPVRRRRDRVVVNAVWGLGAGAVDGTMAADTLWLDRSTLEVAERRIVDKAERYAFADTLRREPVPDEQRRAPCLPAPWARRIAEFALEAERLAGAAQDVEWAIVDDRVWILQTRPIAALRAELRSGPAFPAPDDVRPAWRLGPSDVRRPLEQDIMASGDAVAMESALRNGGQWVQERRFLCGRQYSRRVPSGLGEGDIRVRQQARRARVRFLREHDVTPWERLQPEVAETVRRLGAREPESADGPNLADHLEDAFGADRHHWTLHWVMASENGDFLAPFREALEAATGLEGEEASRAGADLLAGEDNVLTRLIDRVYALGRMAADIPAVAAVVNECPEDAGARLRALDGAQAAEFRAALEDLLAEHGERCGAGFGSAGGLHRPTWRERPDLLVGLIRPYLDPSVQSPAEARARARQAREEQLRAMCAQAKDPRAAEEVVRLLPLVRRVKADLENHNHYIDQMSRGQLRRAILAAGRLLAGRAAIAAADDVWWLHRRELTAALRAGSSCAETVAARRREYAGWEAEAPPPILGVPDPALDPRPPLRDEATPADAGGDAVRGEGASPGVRRGRACVCEGATLLPALAPGDILVARNAGPQWTPLFPILGGLVLEEGVLLQHAASTAREYGIPAVIRAAGATTRIADGAWITVDGGAGVVEIG